MRTLLYFFALVCCSSCYIDRCHNNKQDPDEDGVDCGGECKDCYTGSGCYFNFYYESSQSNSNYQLLEDVETSAAFHSDSYFDLSSRTLFFGKEGTRAKIELSDQLDIEFVSTPVIFGISEENSARAPDCETGYEDPTFGNLTITSNDNVASGYITGSFEGLFWQSLNIPMWSEMQCNDYYAYYGDFKLRIEP
jgi:hypothetical protein